MYSLHLFFFLTFPYFPLYSSHNFFFPRSIYTLCRSLLPISGAIYCPFSIIAYWRSFPLVNTILLLQKKIQNHSAIRIIRLFPSYSFTIWTWYSQFLYEYHCFHVFPIFGYCTLFFFSQVFYTRGITYFFYEFFYSCTPSWDRYCTYQARLPRANWGSVTSNPNGSWRQKYHCPITYWIW